MISLKWNHTLFTNSYISNIVSYNTTQTLRFKYPITFLNLYELQISTQPQVYHNIRECEVTLSIVIKKYVLIDTLLWCKNKPYKNYPVNSNLHKTNGIKLKIMILQKSEKKASDLELL